MNDKDRNNETMATGDGDYLVKMSFRSTANRNRRCRVDVGVEMYNFIMSQNW